MIFRVNSMFFHCLESPGDVLGAGSRVGARGAGAAAGVDNAGALSTAAGAYRAVQRTSQSSSSPQAPWLSRSGCASRGRPPCPTSARKVQRAAGAGVVGATDAARRPRRPAPPTSAPSSRLDSSQSATPPTLARSIRRAAPLTSAPSCRTIDRISTVRSNVPRSRRHRRRRLPACPAAGARRAAGPCLQRPTENYDAQWAPSL